MDLSPHFTLEEFTRSDAAAAMDPPNDNKPTKEHLANLKTTAKGMEAIRATCGDHPIFVSSGYRNPEVNAAVGGVENSDHAIGYACDFIVRGMPLLSAANLIINSEIKFDQLIHETSRGILHASFNPKMRRQVLTQAGPAGTPVTKGIGNV